MNAAAADSAPAVVLICGTFFIMSEARAELGIEEERDGVILAQNPNSTILRDVQVVKIRSKCINCYLYEHFYL